MPISLIARAAAMAAKSAAKRYGIGAARETGKKSGGLLKGTGAQKETAQLRNRSLDTGRAQGAVAGAAGVGAAGKKQQSMQGSINAQLDRLARDQMASDLKSRARRNKSKGK